jgi:hypothetical protein
LKREVYHQHFVREQAPCLFHGTFLYGKSSPSGRLPRVRELALVPAGCFGSPFIPLGFVLKYAALTRRLVNRFNLEKI